MPDRNFRTAFGYEKSQPVFLFIKDANTEDWRPASTDDFSITNNGDINVSLDYSNDSVAAYLSGDNVNTIVNRLSYLPTGIYVTSATYNPSGINGGRAHFAFDRENGGLLVNQGKLDYTQDTVTSAISGTNVDTIISLLQKPTGVMNYATAASASSIQLVTGSSTQKGVSLFNNSSSNLYLRLGELAASTNNFSVIVQGSGYYEAPYNYMGSVYGIWSSAVGNAQITKFI